jgi:hypothetical protein
MIQDSLTELCICPELRNSIVEILFVPMDKKVADSAERFCGNSCDQDRIADNEARRDGQLILIHCFGQSVCLLVTNKIIESDQIASNLLNIPIKVIEMKLGRKVRRDGILEEKGRWMLLRNKGDAERDEVHETNKDTIDSETLIQYKQQERSQRKKQENCRKNVTLWLLLVITLSRGIVLPIRRKVRRAY